MLLKIKNIVTAIFALVIVGCSGSEYYTLSPDREKTEIKEGTEIAYLEDDLVYSNIEFENESNGNYVFYVFLFNKSLENINIDPSEIKMIAFDKDKNPLPFKNTFYGIDPSLMMAKLDKDINNRETEHEVNTGLNFVFALINTAVDLSNNNDNDVVEVLENVAIFAENQVNEEIEYSEDVKYYKSQKNIWKYDVLPQIDLDSQEDIGGLVYMPICPEAEYLKIIIPFDKTKHAYFFKKEKISVQ